MKELAKKIVLATCLSMICYISNAQTVIQMEEYGGVYRIPCKVNGAKMKLIFDTGADKVCLSLSMADYLYDNDIITNDDIIGCGSTTVADGSIVDHIKINIKDIEIGGIHLKNVEAVVIDGQNAPLLLGQSAIKKLGKYSISGNKLIVETGNSSNQKKSVVLTRAETDLLVKEADKAFADGSYYVAEEKYKILYENGKLTPRRKLNYVKSLNMNYKVNDCFDICFSIKEEIETKSPEDRAELYLLIAALFYQRENEEMMISYLEQAKFYAKPWSDNQFEALDKIVMHYLSKENTLKAKMLYEDYISKYLQFRNWRPTDCWEKSLTDEFLGWLYYFMAYYFQDTIYSDDKYYVISAAWGNSGAQEICEIRGINYASKKNMYKYSY